MMNLFFRALASKTERKSLSASKQTHKSSQISCLQGENNNKEEEKQSVKLSFPPAKSRRSAVLPVGAGLSSL